MQELSTGVVGRAKARVGMTLRQKWHLDGLLGIGGMAAVYSATHRNGSRGAIKILHPEISTDAEVQRRFLREGYVANSVDHPGTVKVLDDEVAEDGSVFIVMELLEGETLEASAHRRGKRVPPSEALPIIDQLLDILKVAHARGVVHRDIKPDNVFITTTGAVKLLDFGVARLRMNQGSLATVSGSTFGTPAFMSPEQALGRSEEVDATSDLWSVGATLFTILSGRKVHLARTVNEQLVSHAALPAPSLATVIPDADPGLVALVDRAIAYHKPNRWPDAGAMQDALRRVMAVTGRTVVSAPATPSGAHAPSASSVMGVTASPGGATTATGKKSNVLIGAALGAVVMLAVVVFAARQAMKTVGSPSAETHGSPSSAATGASTPTTSVEPTVAPSSVETATVDTTALPVVSASSLAQTSAAAPSGSAKDKQATKPSTTATKPTTPRPPSGDWLDRQH